MLGIGPALPPGFDNSQGDDSSSDSDDEDVIGPVLPSTGTSDGPQTAAALIEKRAEKMRRKLLNEVGGQVNVIPPYKCLFNSPTTERVVV